MASRNMVLKGTWNIFCVLLIFIISNINICHVSHNQHALEGEYGDAHPHDSVKAADKYCKPVFKLLSIPLKNTARYCW